MRCFGCAYTEVCACCAEGWHVEIAVDMSVAATCMLRCGMPRWHMSDVLGIRDLSNCTGLNFFWRCSLSGEVE